jgi:hypothetical protein
LNNPGKVFFLLKVMEKMKMVTEVTILSDLFSAPPAGEGGR